MANDQHGIDPSDRNELIDLMSRYAMIEDTKDYPKAHDLFTPDLAVYNEAFDGGASGETRGGEPRVGVEAWQEGLRQAVEPLDGTHHMFANFLIEVDGDEASFETKAQAAHVKHGLVGGDVFVLGVTYRIRARRVAGRWRISEVRIAPNWAFGNPEVLAHTRPSATA